MISRVFSLLLACAFSVGIATAETVIIQMKTGQKIEAEIASITKTRISYRNPGGVGQIGLDYAQIETIDFPKPPAFLEAERRYEAFDFEGAAELYKPLSVNRTRATFYPAINNFATVSERRLIDVYRRLHRPSDVRYISDRMEWQLLPASERGVSEVIECWALVGGREWDAALLKIKTVRTESLSPTDPRAAELSYLAGLAHLGKEQPNEALVSFGEAYGPHPGHDPELTAEAMRQATRLLSARPEQRKEMKAVVHLYANLTGEKALWEGAPALATELLAEALDLPDRTQNTAATSDSKGLRARYVRVRQTFGTPAALALSEVEVMSDGYNIAATGTARQSSENQAQPGSAERAIDGVTNGTQLNKSLSQTGNEKNPWWELDLGGVKPIESVVIWRRTDRPETWDKLKGFHLLLLDGDRKEIFLKENNPVPGPSLAVSTVATAKKAPEPAAEKK